MAERTPLTVPAPTASLLHVGHSYDRPRIELAVTAEQYAALCRAAERSGLTVPQWVKSQALRAAQEKR